jgi:polysaccharide biosynthesis protein PelF
MSTENVIQLRHRRGAEAPPTRSSAVRSRRAPAAPRVPQPTSSGRRVLMITEGTYPYAMGGVSSWCDAVIGGLSHIHWDILPIVAGSKRRTQSFELPPNASLLRPIELWSERPAPRRMWRLPSATGGSTAALLARGLLLWEGDLKTLSDALLRCRQRPEQIRQEFRSRDAWEDYLGVLQTVLDEGHPDASPAPVYDAVEAARLYQMLYWIARTAAVPTPSCDLVHITAAGWAVIPGLVHKAMHGTPMLLTEHGVYVREAYLASVRDVAASSCERHMTTRLALGLTRAAYAAADLIAPVTEANGEWERGLGVDAAKIRVIPNGIHAPSEPAAAPNRAKVIAMGRIDPLKDVQTMLLVAREVIRQMPEARFEYWGPPTPGQEEYAAACKRMHAQLGLGDGFRFMGRTSDPNGVIGGGDLVLMTSISEAMPMTLLEAMAQGRPAVATSVGGVPRVLRGCGIVCSPGDVHALATAVVALLRNGELAASLGRRGYERLHRRYTLGRCAEGYGDLIDELINEVAA